MTTDGVLMRLWKLADEFAQEHLYQYLNGQCNTYYQGERPIAPNQSSYSEDIVVAVPTGTSGDVQKGTCIVNVYVNDVIGASSGSYYQDRKRCLEIGEILDKEFVQYANDAECENGATDIFFSRNQEDMVVTLAEPTTHQHFVSLKMDFKVLNTNY